MRRIARPHRLKAFSLVEVMVAVLILAIVVTGSLLLLGMQADFLRRNQERQYITRVLDSRLEEIRSRTFDELLDLPEEITFDVKPALTLFGNNVNDAVANEEFEMALREASGTAWLDPIDNDLLRLTVQVAWKPGNFSDRTLTKQYTTLVTRNGVSRR